MIMKGESDLSTKLRGTAGPGKVDLTGYPGLAYAPSQWGDFVACQSNGTPTSEVAAADEDDILGQVDTLAAKFGVHGREVLDALYWERVNRPRDSSRSA